MKVVQLAEEQFDWYLELRRHGTVKHVGFQINFDQLAMFLTGFGYRNKLFIVLWLQSFFV